MAGVGKILKQAQKMQKKMEVLQEELRGISVEGSAGGGAVKAVFNGHTELTSLQLDPEFLKEDKTLVEETIASAIREGISKAKALNESKMQEATAGFQLPGLFG